jgi:hypothetical protein
MPRLKYRKKRAAPSSRGKAGAAIKQKRKRAAQARGTRIEYLEAVAEEGSLRTPLGERRPDLYPFPHIDPGDPFQRIVLPNNVPVHTVCVPLGNGRWLATEVPEGTAAVANSKASAEDAVRTNVSRKCSTHDFFRTISAAELARSQGVRPIRRVGQIRTLSTPDPTEANWLAREVKRWRREGQSLRRMSR